MATGLTLLALELGSRAIVEPSTVSSGRLLGVELPPFALLPSGVRETGSEPGAREGRHVGSGPLTVGDLWGFKVPDPELTYTTPPSTTSANGWWRTNALGARSDRETSSVPPEGKRRVLVFGESYAAGSRLRGDETWTAALESLAGRLEVVNLAVDGYSMAQAFLRYRRVRNLVAYDAVVLVIVPEVDLWRDVNVRRYLGERWPGTVLMPRFALGPEGLQLVAAPVFGAADSRAKRSDAVLAHLRAHDAFYVPVAFRPPPVIGGSLLYRLGAAGFLEAHRRHVMASASDPDGQAVRVTTAIVSAMRADVESRGARFALIVAPAAETLARGTAPFEDRAKWDRVTGLLCAAAGDCLDALAASDGADSAGFDYGHDGTHYGPRTSRWLAAVVLKNLPDLGG